MLITILKTEDEEHKIPRKPVHQWLFSTWTFQNSKKEVMKTFTFLYYIYPSLPRLQIIQGEWEFSLGPSFFQFAFFKLGRQLISDIIFLISGKAIFVRQILFNPWKGRLFPTDFFRSLASKIIFDRFCSILGKGNYFRQILLNHTNYHD